MKKNGFTLVELVVSIVLVSIVMVSLLTTLLKIRQTYQIVNENSDILIYSSSITRVINSDFTKNNGVRDVYCTPDGMRCEITLGNDDKRRLVLKREDKTDDEKINDVTHTRISTTIKYLDTTNSTPIDETTNQEEINASEKESKLLYIRTLYLDDYRNEKDEHKDVHTTDGYIFYSLSAYQTSYSKNDEEDVDVLTSIKIKVYDGLDLYDEKYDINLYTSGSYDYKESNGKVYRIEFTTEDATEVGTTEIEERYGVGYYKAGKENTASNRINTIVIPKKVGEVFQGYYRRTKDVPNDVLIVDAAGNIVVSNRYFRDDLLRKDADTDKIFAKWTLCDTTNGYIRHDDGTCELEKYNITYKLNGGNLEDGKQNPTVYTKVSDDIILNNPTKVDNTFSGWTEKGSSNQSLNVTIAKGSSGDKEFEAHYCQNCANVSNGTCSLSIGNNGSCNYTTTCNTGYDYESGQNTRNPICKIKTTFSFNYTGKFIVKDGSLAENEYEAKTEGTDVTINNPTWYVKFISSGKLTVKSIEPASVDMFAVGGGGGGGKGNGGGGAGGHRVTLKDQTLQTQSYTIDLGIGGASDTDGTATTMTLNSTNIISAAGGKKGESSSTAVSAANGGAGDANSSAGGNATRRSGRNGPLEGGTGEDGAKAFNDNSIGTELYGAGGGGSTFHANAGKSVVCEQSGYTCWKNTISCDAPENSEELKGGPGGTTGGGKGGRSLLSFRRDSQNGTIVEERYCAKEASTNASFYGAGGGGGTTNGNNNGISAAKKPGGSGYQGILIMRNHRN